ncbi:MAG: serine O-acetyltransferase, partial [Polyangiaceae bacterium]
MVLGLLRRALKLVPDAVALLREDVCAIRENDPAARSTLEVMLVYPGLHALWLHRVAHELWTYDFRFPARLLSHANRFFT